MQPESTLRKTNKRKREANSLLQIPPHPTFLSSILFSYPDQVVNINKEPCRYRLYKMDYVD
jgi:hypothetical protein